MVIFALFVILQSLFWSKMTMLGYIGDLGSQTLKISPQMGPPAPKRDPLLAPSRGQKSHKTEDKAFLEFLVVRMIKNGKNGHFWLFLAIFVIFWTTFGLYLVALCQKCDKFHQNLTIFVQSQLIANSFCVKMSQNETFFTNLETSIVVFVQKRSPLKNSFKMWSFLSLKSQNPHKRLALVFVVFSEKD